MTEHIQVQTTVDSVAAAEAIARGLVEGRLAACVQVMGPIRSTYWWHDAIEAADEWLCVIKTRRDRYEALEAAIRRLHPYEVPQIIALPIVAGSAAYLAWLDASMSS